MARVCLDGPGSQARTQARKYAGMQLARWHASELQERRNAGSDPWLRIRPSARTLACTRERARTHTHAHTHTNTHAHIRAHTLPNESLNMECGLVCWCFDRQTRGRYVTPTWSRQFSSQRPCAMSYIKLQVKKRMTSSMFAGQVADDLIGKQIWLVQAGQE